MKTTLLSILVVSGLTLLSVTASVAQEKTTAKQETINKTPGFVDKNNDGICDNYDGKRIGEGKGEGGGRRALYGDEPQYRNRRYQQSDSTQFRNKRGTQGDRHYRGRTHPRQNYRRGAQEGRGNMQNREGNYPRQQRLQDGTGPDCPNPEVVEKNN